MSNIKIGYGINTNVSGFWLPDAPKLFLGRYMCSQVFQRLSAFFKDVQKTSCKNDTISWDDLSNCVDRFVESYTSGDPESSDIGLSAVIVDTMNEDLRLTDYTFKANHGFVYIEPVIPFTKKERKKLLTIREIDRAYRTYFDFLTKYDYDIPVHMYNIN